MCTPEEGMGMTNSIHKNHCGYGPGAFDLEMLRDDRERHRTAGDSLNKERFTTTKNSQFDASIEQPLARDRRWDRITKDNPRNDNIKLSSSVSGLFEQEKRMKGHRFKDTLKKTRVGKNFLDNQLTHHECLPRHDNWFLTSADYGGLRNAERTSQAHMEPRAATLWTERENHPCKSYAHSNYMQSRSKTIMKKSKAGTKAHHAKGTRSSRSARSEPHRSTARTALSTTRSRRDGRQTKEGWN
jgi:hypothetical protein